MHAYFVEDSQGDLVDIVNFCSDYCHRQWCHDHDKVYEGWNGCQERPDYAVNCANCDLVIVEAI